MLPFCVVCCALLVVCCSFYDVCGLSLDWCLLPVVACLRLLLVGRSVLSFVCVFFKSSLLVGDFR